MENINEGRSQIKRKYGEHGAIRVNNEAPVRNSILEFVECFCFYYMVWLVLVMIKHSTNLDLF